MIQTEKKSILGTVDVRSAFISVLAGVPSTNCDNRLAHVIMLREKARQRELDASESFWYAPADELVRVYNGCGPEWMNKFSRKALTFALCDFEPAILIHDYEFELSDGTRQSFNAANSRLYRNCVRLAMAAYAWYDLRRYRWLRRAVMVWLFCRFGGWSAWLDAYNLIKEPSK